MEPLKPSDRSRALQSGATEADVREYNRLIAERFTTNPYAVKAPGDEEKAKERERRIGDLHQQLFSSVRMHGSANSDAVEAGESPAPGLASRLLGRIWGLRAGARRSGV